jgi:hypothetical protein
LTIDLVRPARPDEPFGRVFDRAGIHKSIRHFILDMTLVNGNCLPGILLTDLTMFFPAI